LTKLGTLDDDDDDNNDNDDDDDDDDDNNNNGYQNVVTRSLESKIFRCVRIIA